MLHAASPDWYNARQTHAPVKPSYAACFFFASRRFSHLCSTITAWRSMRVIGRRASSRAVQRASPVKLPARTRLSARLEQRSAGPQPHGRVALLHSSNLWHFRAVSLSSTSKPPPKVVSLAASLLSLSSPDPAECHRRCGS